MPQSRRGAGIAAIVSDARLASILDTAVDGIIVIDEDGCILAYNKACERMFGYAAEEVLRHNVCRLMAPEHRNEHDGYLDAYRRTGHRKIIGIGREVRAMRKDGSLFPVDLSVGEAATPEGRQFIGILRDLTARHDAERRVTELQSDLIRLARVSALDEMGSALAHELNQPLTALILYLQAVAQEIERAREAGSVPDGIDRAGRVLDKARREARRAGDIIRRVRHLAEKRGPERRPVDLNLIVDEAVDLIVIGQNRLVKVVRDYHRNLPTVEVDPVQIQQVVVNLIRNAFDAVRSLPDPWIVVSTSRDDGHLLLSVEDSGPGIPEGELGHLFQAFKTGGGGMGLGLAISRTIAQSHGGELLVDPGGEGRGARFVLRLPLQSLPDPA